MQCSALVITALVVFGCLNLVSALKCYECTRKTSVGCYTPLDKKVISAVDCINSVFITENSPNSEYRCVYYKDRYKNNQTNVVRMCATKTESRFCDYHRNQAILQGFESEQCVECNDNLCNSANTFRIYYGLLLTCVLSLIFKEVTG